MSNFNLAGQVDKLIASQAGQSPNTDEAFIVKARKKARAERKAKRKEDRATMFAGAVEAFAAGLQAEGLRRHKIGLSGAGFAEAFAAGVGDVVDFSKLQRARKESAIAQKLGFKPAKSESEEADLLALVNALTKGEAGKNSQMGVDPKIDVEVEPGPLDSPEQGGVTKPTDQETLNEAAGKNQTPKTQKTGNPVLDNIITYPEASTLGGRAFDYLGFTVEDENDNGIPDIMENN